MMPAGTRLDGTTHLAVVENLILYRCPRKYDKIEKSLMNSVRQEDRQASKGASKYSDTLFFSFIHSSSRDGDDTAG